MFQEEMFTKGPFKHATFLASGCYGSVYNLSNGYVVKYAHKDGTLNYLEWCLRMTELGKHMPGMPHIEHIVHLGNERYIVVMKCYDKADDDSVRWPHGHVNRCGWSAYNPHRGDEAIPHIDAVLAAYTEYLEANFAFPMRMPGELRPRSPRSYMSDLHAGNFMYDGDLLILTDPSAAPYMGASCILEVTLH